MRGALLENPVVVTNVAVSWWQRSAWLRTGVCFMIYRLIVFTLLA